MSDTLIQDVPVMWPATFIERKKWIQYFVYYNLQVNPFTFPSKPPTSVVQHDHLQTLSQSEVKPHVDVKEEVFIKRESKSESPDGMPRLTPIRTFKHEDQENSDAELVPMVCPTVKLLKTSSIIVSPARQVALMDNFLASQEKYVWGAYVIALLPASALASPSVAWTKILTLALTYTP